MILSSLAGWSFTSTCLWSFQTSCYDLVLISRHYGLRICRRRSQSFGISSDSICDQVCGLFWRKFHVHLKLKRMCIQLSLDVKFCRFVKSIGSSVSFKALISMEMLCLEDLSNIEKARLKSPSMCIII